MEDHRPISVRPTLHPIDLLTPEGRAAVEADEGLLRALNYLAEHVREHPTVEELARVALRSEAAFRASLKDAIDAPYRSLLSRFLVSVGWFHRLRGRTCGEVSELSGDSSRGTTRARFRRELGVPPSAITPADRIVPLDPK